MSRERRPAAPNIAPRRASRESKSISVPRPATTYHAEYKKIDPITKVKDIILKKKYASQKQLDEIEARVKAMVKECEKFAEESQYPEKSLMYDSVYEQKD